MDDFSKKQKELAQLIHKDISYFYQVLELFIWIIFITSQVREGIYLQPFTLTSKEKKDFYRFYVGTQSLEPEKIKKK